ncbi:MAG: hypothetical protein ACOVK2_05830 [Candidatus Fonsibacter sp.]
MSLNIVKKNSSSPFHLQRSIVDQGGTGGEKIARGAYESGGFNPDTVYNNDAANAAVESLGKVIGAGLSSRTEGDKNKSNEKKADRLEKRGQRVEDKKQKSLESGNLDKANRMQKRGERVESRLKETNKQIAAYKETQKPSLKATDLTSPKEKKLDQAAVRGEASRAFKVKNKIGE